jgi:hypothetical protein
VAWFFAFLFLDALVNFFAVHGNLFRRVNANAHLITFNAQHGDSDFVTHHQGLSDPASQNQHSFLLTDISSGQQQSAKKKMVAAPNISSRAFTQVLTSVSRKKVPAHANQKDKRRG